MKMKKIIISVIVACASLSSTYALDLYEYKVFYKLTNENTFNSLVRYLETNYEQEEQLKYIFELTEKKIKNALEKENEVDAEKALWFNLGNAKNILTPEQYKNYLVVINMSVNGSENEFFAEK